MIVSEPFADLPGAWQEIPEATAVCVRAGGALEERPFVPRVERAVTGAQYLNRIANCKERRWARRSRAWST